MRILIDGYNLMHAAGLMKLRFGPGGLEKARRALLGLLAGSLGEDAGHTTVVFDAAPSGLARDEQTAGSVRGIAVAFASGEDQQSADALIEQLIRLDSTPKQLTVVSSDARIRVAARRRGARPVDSEAFLDELSRRRWRSRGSAGKPQEKPGELAASEAEFWLKEFERGIDQEDLRELAGPFPELE